MADVISRLANGMKGTRLASWPVAVMGLLAFGVYAFVMIGHEVGEGEFQAFDTAIILFFRDPADLATPVGPAWLEEAALEITALGGFPVLILLIGLVLGFLLAVEKYGPAAYLLLATSGGAIVSTLLKHVYERPRPNLVEQLDKIHTPSFPSGHALIAMVTYLTLGTLIARLVDRITVRVYVFSAAIFLAFIIGVSRIYLGVHWPTDVLAGWALGGAWAALCWLAVTALRRYRRRGRSGDRARKVGE